VAFSQEVLAGDLVVSLMALNTRTV